MEKPEKIALIFVLFLQAFTLFVVALDWAALTYCGR